MQEPKESSQPLVSSSRTTQAWLNILRDRLPQLNYRETKYWATFRDSPSGAAIASINPSKGSMRLFLPLAPEEHDHLQPSPSSKAWGKRFPSVFRIDQADQLEIAVFFISLSSKTSVGFVDVEARDMPDESIDREIRSDRLRIGVVPTDTEVGLVRQRRGQERVRHLTLQNYESVCALCDVADPALLVASHIVGWAEVPEARGILSNVICLCRFHDFIFDQGFWSLADDYTIIRNSMPPSQTLDFLLRPDLIFRKPQEHPPASRFLQQHRLRWGLETD